MEDGRGSSGIGSGKSTGMAEGILLPAEAVESNRSRPLSLIHRYICQSHPRSEPVRLANYFANKATILANNARTVMIQEKLSNQKRKVALFGNRK